MHSFNLKLNHVIKTNNDYKKCLWQYKHFPFVIGMLKSSTGISKKGELNSLRMFKIPAYSKTLNL